MMWERDWWEEDLARELLDTREVDGVLHIGPDVGRNMSPDDELEESELGERVSSWLLDSYLGSLNSRQEDREFCMVSYMVRAVASQTSWRGLPFPAEWWPPLAGPMPPGMEDSDD